MLVQRYVDLFGSDELDKFERNLSDFLAELYRINWETMAPPQQFQTALLLKAVDKLEGKVEQALKSGSPASADTVTVYATERLIIS